MKKLFVKVVEFLSGAEVHATHTAIKGKKSSGSRDASQNTGADWKQGNDSSYI